MIFTFSFHHRHIKISRYLSKNRNICTLYQKLPPILLFISILSLFFKKISHLFVYSGLYFYSFLKKIPTYTFIWSYTFISFPKKSCLYFYSEPSSIWNSRVPTPLRRRPLWMVLKVYFFYFRTFIASFFHTKLL